MKYLPASQPSPPQAPDRYGTVETPAWRGPTDVMLREPLVCLLLLQGFNPRLAGTA